MPIDPSILLGFRGPQINDPLETAQRIMSLKQLGQLGRYRDVSTRKTEEDMAYEREQRKLEREQEELAKKRTEAYNKALRDNTTIDDKTGKVNFNENGIEAALARSGYPDLVQKYKEGRFQIEKSLKEMKEADLKRTKEEAALFAQLAGSVVNAKPEHRAKAYAGARTQAKQLGLQIPDALPEQYSEDFLPDLEQIYWGSLSVEKQAELTKPKDVTGSLQEFKTSFYPGWLQDNNLAPNAVNERKAYEEWKNIGRTKAAPSTIRTQEGVMQWNEQTQKFDTKAGDLPKTTRDVEDLTDEDIDGLARQVGTGQVNITNLPSPVRLKVLKSLSARGQTILPKELRTNLSKANTAFAILDKLEDTLEDVEKSKGTAEFAKNILRLQREATGTARQIGRAFGEVGVFTDQDKEDFRRLLTGFGGVAGLTTLAGTQPKLIRTFLEDVRDILNRTLQRQFKSGTASYEELMQQLGSEKDGGTDIDALRDKYVY